MATKQKQLEMEDSHMNKWLDTTVSAYKRYFGEATSPIIYEVGSRDGKDGIELAERIFDGVPQNVDHKGVILFEPNPAQAKVIKKAYPNAVLLNLAASDRNGKADFLQISDPTNEAAVGSSSMDLRRRRTKPGIKRVIKVNTERLDSVMGNLKHLSVDIMKIDAEGYSYEILQGLGSRLGDIKVLHIETEMVGDRGVTNKTNRDVFAFMRDAGFLCYALEYEWGGIEDQVWVNAEALRCAK